jgi:hypothetical protein
MEGKVTYKTQRIQYHFLIFILLLLLIFLPVIVWSETLPPSSPQNMTWKGSISNQKEQFIKVVETKEQWSELWKRAFDKPAPAVDFEKHVVACVFLGYSADWLYSIGFGQPFLRDNLLVIPFGLAEIMLELSGPFKASGQYSMKVFEKKKDVKIVMEETAQSYRVKR